MIGHFRGQRLGTILVDLEQHRVVEVLPESTEQAFSAWLRTHPGVEIISRDRGQAYARGGQLGAPEAIHVADRWHVLKNLSDSVQKLLARHGASLRQAAHARQMYGRAKFDLLRLRVLHRSGP